MHRISKLLIFVVLLMLVIPVGVVAAQDDGEEGAGPYVLIAPGDDETAGESYWPIRLDVDNGVYDWVIAGLFAALFAMGLGWGWLTNKTMKDAMAALPPEYSDFARTGLAMVALAVKMTNSKVDDRAFDAMMKALGIDLTLPTPEDPPTE